MNQLEKLIEQVRAKPPQADFADVQRLLEAFGYEKRRQMGSHVSFKKAGAPTITLPLVSGRKVKRVYLDKICGLLGLED